jgi:glycyl-tRNA synthetase alpha subunit
MLKMKCYSLVLSVCRLLNYLEVKGQRPLMQIEELRGDYRAITWTVELRIGLERLSMAVADLEPVFDLNGQNQGAVDE